MKPEVTIAQKEIPKIDRKFVELKRFHGLRGASYWVAIQFTGYDSDHSLALGEVGRVGVPIDTPQDMEILFKGIPLDKVSTSMTINATAPILLAMYVALAKKQGIDPAKLNGTIQNDVLKEYIARGTYVFPPQPSMKLITDIFEYCSKSVPRWNSISICGYHFREAGATAAQEAAFTLHLNLFEEVAKFRAARRLWAKIMR